MQLEPKDFLATLLTDYSFDSSDVTIQRYIDQWLEHYSSKWIASAIVESIYQGRYKLVSVDRILTGWRLKKQVSYHFDYDFAELVCQKVAQQCAAQCQAAPASVSTSLELLPLPQVAHYQTWLAPVAVPSSSQSGSRATGLAIAAAVKLVTKLAPIAQAA